MAIFAVIGQPGTNAGKLPEAIRQEPQNNVLQVQDSVWLLAYRGTVIELCNHLQIADGTNGTAVVFEVGAYYGRASPNLWAWIKEKWEQTSA